MDFRILGPVEVWHEDRRVPVSAPRQRAVLASLLSRPGSSVPVTTIIDDLWGARPPSSAAVTIRNYVRRLRSVLPEPVLDSSPGGYRLRIRPDQLDAHRLGALARQARKEPDPERAATLFEQALSLWRGTPLLGIGDAPLRDVQAPKLEELHLAALEDSIALSLRRGRNSETLPTLTELAARYPLRERVRGQLMTALHHGGRAAEALEHYRDIRTRLVTELGMEPGSELRELEQAILRDTVPSPSSPPSAPASNRPGRAHAPVTLPVPSGVFVGRSAEFERLTTRLTSTTPSSVCCLVHGPGGAGKSTLAVRVAHRVATHFPDGVCYVDLHGATPGAAPLTAGDVLRALIRALGGADVDPRKPVEVLARVYRSRLRGRRVLVVLDDARSAAQTLPALPDGPGCAALVTSREAFGDPADALRVHLDAFDTGAAVALLGEIVGPHRVQAERRPAEEVVDLCGGLPLAVSVLAHRIALRPHWPLREWAVLLRDEHRRLDQFRFHDIDVRAGLSVSLDALDETDRGPSHDAATLFRHLGAVDGNDCTPSLVSALTGWAVPRGAAALEVLVDSGLAYSIRPGRYALYDLLRVLAHEHAADSDGSAVLAPAVATYLSWVRACAEQALGPGVVGYAGHVPLGPGVANGHSFPDCEAAVSWLDAELDVLVKLLAQAAAERLPNLPDVLIECGRLLPWYFNHSRRLAERHALAETMLTVAHAEDHAPLETVAVNQLAVIEAQRGNLDAAEELVARAVESTPSAHRFDRIVLQTNRAGIAMLREELPLAEEWCARALEDADRAGYDSLRSSCLANLAVLRIRQGALDDAVELLHTVAGIDRSIGHLAGLAVCLNTLAELHVRRGEHAEVSRCAAQALPLHARVGSDLLAAECLIVWSRSLWEWGRHDAARERYGQARDRLRRISTREQIRLAVLLDQLPMSGAAATP